MIKKGAERDDEALRLRLHEALEFREIAGKLGYPNTAGARRAVERAIGRLPKHQAEEYRRMMTERLEHLYHLVHQKAQDGDPDAIKVAAGIAGQQAKLYGTGGSRKVEPGKESAVIPITLARQIIGTVARREAREKARDGSGN
jgi:hypothetical protein